MNKNISTDRIFLVGIGNSLRNDDGVGIYITRKLSESEIANVTFMEHYGDGAGLLEIIKEASVLFLFDAVNSDARAGTIHRHELSKNPLPVNLSSSSSHQFGIAEGLELARVLGELPERLIFFGVEGADFNLNSGLSENVKTAADEIVEEVQRELSVLPGYNIKSRCGTLSKSINSSPHIPPPQKKLIEIESVQKMRQVNPNICVTLPTSACASNIIWHQSPMLARLAV